MLLNSLQRGLEILFLFKNYSIMSVPEIALHLNFPISSTYRYISNLKSKGLIDEHEKKGYYKLGPKILELAQAFNQQFSIADIALPVMQQLQKETEETIILLTPQRHKVVCIERIESNHALRFSPENGRTMFMHAGASTKVIMAYLDESEQNNIIEEGLPKFTKNTITDPRKLKKDLRHIRKNGFAIGVGELEPGTRGIAAPILGRDRKIIAGLGLIGPASRITGIKINNYTHLVIEAANEIAKRLNRIVNISNQHKGDR